jgi:hypothetical protein
MKINTSGEIFRAALRNKPALFASIIAPALMSNDDRGYFQTAAVTTPLIYVGQHMFKNMGNRLTTPTERIFSGPVNPIDLGGSVQSTRQLFQSTKHSDTDVSIAISKFLKNIETGGRNYDKERKKLKNMLERYATTDADQELADLLDPGVAGQVSGQAAHDALRDYKQKVGAAWNSKGRRNYTRASLIKNNFSNRGEVVGNAFVKAMSDSLTPSELVKLPQSYIDAKRILTTRATSLVEFNKAVNAVYSTFSHRDAFVGSLVPSLTRARDLVNGPGSIPKLLSIEAEQAEWSPIDSFNKVDKKISASYKNLEEAISLRRPNHLIGAFEHPEGTGMSLRFRQGKGTEDLFIPFKSQANRGTNSYLLRTVRDAENKEHELHEWISSIILKRPQIGFDELKGEVDSFVTWHDKSPYAHDVAPGTEPSHVYSSDLAAAIQDKKSSISTLPIFAAKKGDGYRKYRDLDAKEQVDLITDAVNKGWGLPLGSEGGINDHATLERSELENFHPWGISTLEKQEAGIRDFSKDVSIVSSGSALYGNSAYETLAPGMAMPETNMYVSHVAAEHKALFAGMPDTLEEFQANRAGIAEKFAKHGAGEDFMQYLDKVYEAGGQGMFPKFGQMGETEWQLSPSFADANSVKAKRLYELDHGTPKYEPGDLVAAGDVIGYKDNVPVTAEHAGTMTGAWGDANSQAKDRYVQASIESNLGMDGSKLARNTVKGLGFRNEWHENMRDMLNEFSKSRGTGDYIPEETNAFADLSYGLAKEDIGYSQSSLMADMLNRMHAVHEQGDHDLFGSISQSKLSSFYDINDGMVTNMVGDLSKNRMDKFAHAEALFKSNQEFLDEVNRRVKSRIEQGGVISDTALDAYARSKSTNISEWFGRNISAGNTRAWDHMALNRAQTQSITFDMFDYAMAHGQVGAIKELQGRVKFYGGGDLAKTTAFAKGDVQGRLVSIEDIYNPDNLAESGDPSKPLSSPEGRRNSVMDPTMEDFKDNYRVNLGPGADKKDRIINVPGNEAYGGTSPKFADDQYQVRDHHRILADMHRNRNNPEKIDSLMRQLQETYNTQLITGKGSVVRPSSFDPGAVSGFLRTVTDKESDNIVTIGQDIFDTIKDRQIRTALQNGDDVTGMFWRQPISNTKHIRIKYDANMTGGGIGASERLYRMFEADTDKDPVGISFWRKGGWGHKEAMAEMTGPDANKAFDIYEQIHGPDENSLGATADTVLKSQQDIFNAWAEKVKDPERIIRNRTAAGAIGAFSNQLTNVLGQMSNNVDMIRDTDRSMRLSTFFHGAIRQTPINARKYTGDYDYVKALADRHALHDAVANTRNEDEAYGKFYDALSRITSISDKPNKTNYQAEYLNSDLGRDDIRAFIRGRTEESRVRAQLMIGGGGEKLQEVINKAEKMGWDNVLGSAHRGGWSQAEGAESIGRVNKNIVEAGKKIGYAIKDTFRNFSEKHGKTAVMAAGALVALGLMSNSSNRAPLNRPEEAAGIQDHMPGTPIVGSMAANPPRNIVQPASVRTSVITPMNRTTNTSIRLRAKDPSDAIERSKSMSAFAGGAHQNININVSSDPRIGTLRFKEKMRNMREDNG